MRRKTNAAADWSRWYLVPEKNKVGDSMLKIKRYRTVEGQKKWERYPAGEYKGLSQPEVEAMVRRINASYEIDRKAAEERYNFSHTFINQMSIERFESHLDKAANDDGHKNTVIQLLNDYVFEFFVLRAQLPDPSRWHLKEDDWGSWLMAQDLSPATLRKIVGVANRFNKFLTDRVYPEMATPRKLEPIGKAKLESLDRERAKSGSNKTKYIKKEVFNKIIAWAEKQDPEIIPNMVLCYSFGLRISETLGLTKEKFLKDNLLVDEQGDRLEEGGIKRKSVKTNARRVPYWNLSAKEAWALVKQIKPMHPDTLVRRVNECLEKFDHTSHDFRRSFITNSFRTAPHWKDVQRAAGHSDVRVTMGYDQDDRELSEDKADLD